MVPYFCSYLVLSLSSLSNGFWLTSTVKREARRATVALVKVESTVGCFLLVIGFDLLPIRAIFRYERVFCLCSGYFGLSTTVGGAFTPLLGWFADRYGIPHCVTRLTR